jgi:hypothetical protein
VGLGHGSWRDDAVGLRLNFLAKLDRKPRGGLQAAQSREVQSISADGLFLLRPIQERTEESLANSFTRMPRGHDNHLMPLVFVCVFYEDAKIAHVENRARRKVFLKSSVDEVDPSRYWLPE